MQSHGRRFGYSKGEVMKKRMKAPSIKPIGYNPGQGKQLKWVIWGGVVGVLWYYWDIISAFARIGLAILGAGGHVKT